MFASYTMIFAKLGLGLLIIIFQINIMGKGNLAPTSALDQVQNYVLGGIIGGVIYNNDIGILQFILILIAWTILVMILKYAKTNSFFVKSIIDGKPAMVINKGIIMTNECMRCGLQAHELHLKLRAAGVKRVQDVRKAVLEQNGQLTIMQYGEDDIRYPLVEDGQVSEDVLELIDKDRQWLEEETASRGCEIKDIYLAEYVGGKVIVYPYTEKRK